MADELKPCPSCGADHRATIASGEDHPAWDEYQRVTAAAWDEYERVTDAAWTEYRRVKAAALQHLLNCLNAVTAKHRHGQPVSKRRLDDLANAQLDYEEAERDE